jgi:hypothetical protein
MLISFRVIRRFRLSKIDWAPLGMIFKPET